MKKKGKVMKPAAEKSDPGTTYKDICRVKFISPIKFLKLGCMQFNEVPAAMLTLS